MSVFQNRPYERHMVSNIPTLLAPGNTIDSLGVGQLGIFDAKTNLSVAAPTYQNNKTIYIAQGTPDRSNFPEGAMVPNIVRRTHNIQGKKLISLRAKKANRGQGEIVVLGNTGVTGDPKTLTAKPGEIFYYWVRLTGDPIFNLNPDQAKGVIIQGAVEMPCADDCADNCTSVDCQVIADGIVADFNTKKLPGGADVFKYVQANAIKNCETSAAIDTVSFYKHSITIPSCGSNGSFGSVQAQAPGFVVTNEGTVNGYTTYSVVAADCDVPEDFVLDGGSIIPNCNTCPDGFTSVPAGLAFEVKFNGNTVTVGTINGLLAAYDGETTILQFDTLVNVTTYEVKVEAGTTAAQIETALTGNANYLDGSVTLIGETAASCTNDSPITYEWDNADCSVVFCNKAEVQFNIYLKDDLCGNSLLTELQAFYAGLTQFESVAIIQEVGADNSCGRNYLLTTVSTNCVEPNCAPSAVQFPEIPSFRGSEWIKVDLATPGTCLCGVEFKGVFVPRVTREATFDEFAYQTDYVHIEVSSHNPDWRSTDLCEVDPISTRVQAGAYPNGSGQAVARLEKQDRMYDMDYFYMSPVLREAFDFYFETKFNVFYDMVAVEYEFQYSSNNGFGQTDTDRYIQYFWLPETQAGELITALNTYAASANINVDLITL